MIAARPVAIAGIGCLCAAGLSLADSMTSLYAGRRHPKTPTRFSFEQNYSFPVFEITADFFPADRLRNTHRMRTAKLALTATLEALGDAGLSAEQLRNANIGVCIGTNVGSAMNNEAFYRDNIEGCNPYISPIDRFGMTNPTENIATEFKCGGPCQTVVNACSAGSDALGLAASWIRSGTCDAVIAGGADELYRVTYTGFKSLFINDASACKPFDAQRNGLNLGEGAAIFILVSETLLQDLGLKPRGFIYGYGSASDAYHFTRPRPDGRGLVLAINAALQEAGMSAADVDFINAHGTGTKDNDLIESRVLDSIFPGIPFLSTKGYTGHTLGASGALEAAFTIACLENKLVPASIGFKTPDPELPSHPVRVNTAIEGSVAISQTLAFGGNNAVLALGTEGEVSG
jgi:3-oxoacyl-[acyl-carrier-protein] synthase-1/3-oxoacyl-[acyl-carrier-protein] synthase II